MIYDPREDSFLLKRIVQEEVKPNDIVLDMGTGSGLQALTAHKIAKNVTAADINPEAITLMEKRNTGIRCFVSDLFENISKEEKFTLIIFNPPYLPKDPDEPEDSAVATTGGKKGDEIIKRFLPEAKHYLKKGGRILLVYSSLSGDAKNIIKKEGYHEEIKAEKSYFMETVFVSLLSISN